jgi:hypothetical protein
MAEVKPAEGPAMAAPAAEAPIEMMQQQPPQPAAEKPPTDNDATLGPTKPGSLTKRTGRRAGSSASSPERSESSHTARLQPQGWNQFGQNFSATGRTKPVIHPYSREEHEKSAKWQEERRCARLHAMRCIIVDVCRSERQVGRGAPVRRLVREGLPQHGFHAATSARVSPPDLWCRYQAVSSRIRCLVLPLKQPNCVWLLRTSKECHSAG